MPFSDNIRDSSETCSSGLNRKTNKIDATNEQITGNGRRVSGCRRFWFTWSGISRKFRNKTGRSRNSRHGIGAKASNVGPFRIDLPQRPQHRLARVNISPEASETDKTHFIV
ncbi:hypothetical protein GWI33_000146 [Rhynchophorus ferrugineus]|uniref:Uncharacterized protein n=1 Tax=Rhynchophorus ferrugineus TaxID=354439 RepID=A0A834IY88_RHYFE|nr:hypothetical protein GWI33_000146 [Rhynchophorus ferrugineus]